MPYTNIEIKTRCAGPERIREILKSLNARFVGTDHQVDTYFNVPKGRLKLREGNIENSLIYYQRADCAEPKQSNIVLFKIPHSFPSPLRGEGGGEGNINFKVNSTLKNVLKGALGIKIVVDKKREIYFIDNVKFHIDSVEGLGEFVEIEAIDENGNIGAEKLRGQCQYYLKMFGIKKEDLISNSYSDLLLRE